MRIILRDTCGKYEVCAFVVVGDLNESWRVWFSYFSKNFHACTKTHVRILIKRIW